MFISNLKRQLVNFRTSFRTSFRPIALELYKKVGPSGAAHAGPAPIRARRGKRRGGPLRRGRAARVGSRCARLTEVLNFRLARGRRSRQIRVGSSSRSTMILFARGWKKNPRARRWKKNPRTCPTFSVFFFSDPKSYVKFE